MANLRRLPQKNTFPQFLTRCWGAFEKLIGGQVRNTLATDALVLQDDGKALTGSRRSQLTEPSSDTAKLFSAHHTWPTLPRRVYGMPSMTHKGITYSVHSRHEGNSCILVRDSTRVLIPLVIKEILENPGDSNIYIVAYRFKQITQPNFNDPFQRFEVLGAKMWGQSFEEKLHILHPTMIEGNFTKLCTTWDGAQVTVVLPLNKVGDSISVTLCFAHV